MKNDASTRVGRLAFLSDDDKQAIYEAALHILAEIGMRLNHDEAQQIMLDAGCTLDDDGRVHVPAELVGRTRGTAPARFTLHDRDGEPAYEVGGYDAVFGTGSDLMNLYDLETGERRKATLADVGPRARLCDALDNIDFVMSSAYPHEVDAHRAYLEEFRAMVANTTKPLVMTAEGGRRPAVMVAVARELRGGPTSFAPQPYFVVYDQPSSPLEHPVDSIDKLLLLRRRRRARHLLGSAARRRHGADHRRRSRGAGTGRVALRPGAAPDARARGSLPHGDGSRRAGHARPRSPPTTPPSTCSPTPASSRWRSGSTCPTGATAAPPTRRSWTRRPASRSPSSRCSPAARLQPQPRRRIPGLRPHGLVRADRHRRRVHRHEPAPVRRRRGERRHAGAGRHRQPSGRAATS